MNWWHLYEYFALFGLEHIYDLILKILSDFDNSFSFSKLISMHIHAIELVKSTLVEFVHSYFWIYQLQTIMLYT